MLFVHTNGPTESGTEMRTPKQAVRAILMAPPWTIEGQIHLPYESEVIRLSMPSGAGSCP